MGQDRVGCWFKVKDGMVVVGSGLG
ncbi:hypothetical protein RDABS01_033387 [Bienertia sinuspersici]